MAHNNSSINQDGELGRISDFLKKLLLQHKGLLPYFNLTSFGENGVYHTYSAHTSAHSPTRHGGNSI